MSDIDVSPINYLLDREELVTMKIPIFVLLAFVLCRASSFGETESTKSEIFKGDPGFA